MTEITYKKAWPFKLDATVDPRPNGTNNPNLVVEPCSQDEHCTLVWLHGWGDGLVRHVRHTELLALMVALQRRKKEILG